MSDTDRNPEITPLVRQYSLKMEQSGESDSLHQALSLVVKKQDAEETRSKLSVTDWNQWLQSGQRSSDDLLEPLELQRKELVQTWEEFQHLFQDEGDPVQPNTIPTIETLRYAIDQAQNTWLIKKSKGFSKAKDRFTDFLDTMNDYSELFSVIPSGDKYFSLISGTVSSVVKASVNHKRISEGFSMALVDMCSDLRFVNRTVSVSDSAEIRQLVAELYVGVFRFLCHTLHWFRRRKKRFLSAFDKSFYDDTVLRLVQAVQKTVQRIKDESQRIANSQVARVDGRVEQIDGRIERMEGMMINQYLSLRSVGIDSRHDDMETTRLKLESVKESLGYSSVRTLESVKERLIYDTSPSIQRDPTPSNGIDGETEQLEEVSTSEDDSGELYSRHDIEQLTRPLAAYLDDGRDDVFRAVQGDASSMIPSEVLVKIQGWLQQPDSRIIWVSGTPVALYGSGLSLAALRLCTIIVEAGIPCVSYFCKRRSDLTSTSCTDKESLLVSLLYSIVTQLAYLLPPHFTETAGLNEAQFRLLDGSIESAPVALDLIRVLLTRVPTALIWVLDGLQFAESQSTNPHLRDLFDILRKQKGERLSKICFTTDGNSSFLMTKVDVTERVDASRNAQLIPRNRLIGGSDLRGLKGPTWRGGGS